MRVTSRERGRRGAPRSEAAEQGQHQKE